MTKNNYQMSQQLSLSSDQLKQQSRELDEREAAIAEREQLADKLDKVVTHRQHELKMLDTTILARDAILKEQTARMAELDKEYIRKGIVLQNTIDKQQESYENWQSKVSDVKIELQEVKDSILERKTYYKDQEDLIVKQSADGNLQLRGLEYAIIEAKQVIKDLKVERTNVFEDKNAVIQDLEDARQSFLPELDQHNAAVLVIVQQQEVAEGEIIILQDKLNDLNKQISAGLAKRQQIHDDVDAKLTFLDGKEREIMAKREALRTEEEAMEEKRHHYSRDSLYDSL